MSIKVSMGLTFERDLYYEPKTPWEVNENYEREQKGYGIQKNRSGVDTTHGDFNQCCHPTLKDLIDLVLS
jgi:hypothetical protein